MIQFITWSLHFSCLISFCISLGICNAKQHLNYKGLYSQEVVNYEVVIPKRVDNNGNFISNLIPHHYKRSTKESDHIFYKLPIAGEEYMIQLIPNLMLTSPGAVFEIHREDSKDNTTNKKLKNFFEELEIRPFREENCHYSGFVRGINSSKVAVSTCFGLAGFIQTKNGTYTIEPAAGYHDSSENELPHILYKDEINNHNWTVCNTLEFGRNRNVREIKENENDSNGSATIYPMYIETLIVLDKSFVKHNEKFDSENYILTVFNMAFSLFHDASLGFLIKLSLARVIRLEVDEDEMNVDKNQDPIKSLEGFQEWQHRMNPGDDTHPNHHDVAILITRVDTYTNLPYGFLGVSTLGSACDKKRSAILCKDSGLRLGFVIAHEIAHLLGAEHDGFNNSCVGLDGDGFRTVMHPQVFMATETWSKCTHGYIKAFLESGFGHCLYDEPSQHHFNIQDLLPGTVYDADFQCRQLLASFARECDEGSTCDSLNCQIPGHLCFITKVPPATGTRCGENMWCRQKRCLMEGQRPNAIDGKWGDWSPWSECSRTCGSGVSSSERHCNKPVPSHGGRYCSGNSRRHKICSSKPCDVSQPSFRDLQCAEFDDWIYPEDGLKHQWKAYFFHDENPCILFCVNDNLEVVALKPRVVDGTSCYPGIRDICIEGECKSIPCDLNLESKAVEDICGVCHGDGTTCDFLQGQQSMEKFPKAITKLIKIPAGTRNIKVEVLRPSAARILVRNKETKAFYIRGTKLGMYDVPGSQAWLGMPKNRQAALSIPGPVTKPLAIWIERVENVTVKWSMAVPTTQQRKASFAWDFIQWSPCSALCGPGTQKSEPSCVEEKAGLVESSYCAGLDVPPAKVKFCENAKCEPRWMVTDWKDCENISSSQRVRRRLVRCVKTFGEGESESEIVPDEECLPPKPQEVEPCETRPKRDSEEHVIEKKSILNNELVSMFSSNGMKFGSHKKYDEYLKNFNAIATPQRKSETIPLHLLNTPHFKHYYRVLKTPSYEKTDDKIDTSFDKTLSSDKTKADGLLTEVHKNTFSGNQKDLNEENNNANAVENPTDWLNSFFGKKNIPGSLSKNNHYGLKRALNLQSGIYHGGTHIKKKNKKQGKIISSSSDDSLKHAVIHKSRNRRKTGTGGILKFIRKKKRESRVRRRKLKHPNWKPILGFGHEPGQGESATESPPEKYSIRFGQVLIDTDEDADLEIILEENDKNDIMGMESMRSPGDKIWKIHGEVALQLLQNISSLDLHNKTTDD